MEHNMLRRFGCALCALAFALTVLPTAAFAQQPEEQAAVQQSLSATDVREMQQADAAVTALTEGSDYAQMTEDERTDAALQQLDELTAQGLVKQGSVYTDAENGLVSFTYSCGVLGGILLTSADELDEMTLGSGENGLRAPRGIAEGSACAAMPLTEDVRQAAIARQAARQDDENALPDTIGRAAIYYAFDNTVNSSRFPYYSYMQGFWEGMGIRTTMNTKVTLADLRRMDRYDLCILSAHGAYYTYSCGTLWKRTRTEPIILLTEESTLYKDIIYSFDLLSHRVIKMNGLYCVTADFFRNAYRSGQLSNTIVYSETCEFLGITGSVDESMAEALLAGGARAVLGYVNNVYTVYSRSMLWDTINHLGMGMTIGQAVTHAKDTYGENDILWYTSQGGRRPHAAAAYLVLYGDPNAGFDVPEGYSVAQRADEITVQDILEDVLDSAA